MKKALNEEHVRESMVTVFMKQPATQPNFRYRSLRVLDNVSRSVEDKVENKIEQVLTLTAVNTLKEINA